MSAKVEKEHKMERVTMPPPPPLVESRQLGVGVGHANAAHLSACPFRGCRTARCLLHTPPSLVRGNLKA